MTSPHPTIQYFAETDAATFPLILVIGREPNTARPIANTIGPYDFRDAPWSSFWNTSYAMLAKLTRHRTREFKQLCLARKSSPLIYADALPHGLLNEVADKRSRRTEISAEAAAAHIDNVFSHHVLIERVRLVVISGLQNELFATARVAIAQNCKQKTIGLIHLPFFFGTNSKKIAQALSDKDRALMRGLCDQFFAHQP